MIRRWRPTGPPRRLGAVLKKLERRGREGTYGSYLGSNCRNLSSTTVIPKTDMVMASGSNPGAPRLEQLKTDATIFIQGAAATPNYLIHEMVTQAKQRQLRNIRTVHLHLEGAGPLPKGDTEAAAIFKPTCLFVGGNMRRSVEKGDAGYVPVFLYEIPLLFRRRIIEPDIALVQVSPPDKHGYCSLGTSVDITVAALEVSKSIVGQVNEHMPRTLGDGLIHISRFDELIPHNEPMFQISAKNGYTTEEQAIGKLIAEELVVNGATLQMGIGNIPDAVLASLTSHKDLGVHTEMFSDGVLPLIKTDVINNSRKSAHHGKTITSFAVGSQELYDYINDNQAVNFLDVSYVNDPHRVSQMPAMTAINSCIEIDITGQVCSDSIGEKVYSGFGGQVDFIRGASMCPDGKAIIALQSRTKRGVSRIVPHLKAGAGVVTTRAHVHYVVSEHGIAFLFGKTLQQRAKEMIDIAHPEDREYLERHAYERFGREKYHIYLGKS